MLHTCSVLNDVKQRKNENLKHQSRFETKYEDNVLCIIYKYYLKKSC